MRTELLGKLSPFRNNLVKVTEYQQTNDIIRELLKGHEKWAKEYDKISGQFWMGSTKRSLKHVFDYLKNNIKYKIEPDTRQSIKSPAAIIATGNNGYNDCKHYSSFFGGLIDSWNRKKLPKKPIEWNYRFANYKLMSTNPHHVFVVAKDKGQEVWCDAVLPNFDQKKPYLNKIDKKPKMALYQISGIGCDCGGSCGSGDDMYGIPQISGKKDIRRQRRAARRYGENCTGRRIPKLMPVAIVGRKAFLTLIRLNILHFGFKMYQVLNHTSTRKKAFEKWCLMGGDANMLKRTVNKWAAGYSRRHPKKALPQINFDGQNQKPILVAEEYKRPMLFREHKIGVVEETGFIATAAPYIAAFTPIIALAAKFMPEGSKAKDIMEKTVEVAETAQSAAEQISQGSGGGESAGAVDLTELGTGAGQSATSAMIKKYLPFAVIGAGAIYLLTRKK
jgi:hypothetical protein